MKNVLIHTLYLTAGGNAIALFNDLILHHWSLGYLNLFAVAFSLFALIILHNEKKVPLASFMMLPLQDVVVVLRLHAETQEAASCMVGAWLKNLSSSIDNLPIGIQGLYEVSTA